MPAAGRFSFSTHLARALRRERGQDALAHQMALASLGRVTMGVNLIRGLPEEVLREG